MQKIADFRNKIELVLLILSLFGPSFVLCILYDKSNHYEIQDLYLDVNVDFQINYNDNDERNYKMEN